MFVALRNLVKYTLFKTKVPQRQIVYFTRFRSATSSLASGSAVPNTIIFAPQNSTILLPPSFHTSGHTSYSTLRQSGVGLALVDVHKSGGEGCGAAEPGKIHDLALRNFWCKKCVFYQVPQRHKHLFALVPGVPPVETALVTHCVKRTPITHRCAAASLLAQWNPRHESK